MNISGEKATPTAGCCAHSYCKLMVLAFTNALKYVRQAIFTMSREQFLRRRLVPSPWSLENAGNQVLAIAHRHKSDHHLHGSAEML